MRLVAECGACGADAGEGCICADLCETCGGTSQVYCECPLWSACEHGPTPCPDCDDGLRAGDSRDS